MVQKLILNKLTVEYKNPVWYKLHASSKLVYFNELINRKIKIIFTGSIFCSICSKKIKKSFFNGYCYSCFINSPEASDCVIKPELCKAHLGLGRDLQWEKQHHLQDHYVYLAVSSGLKVGVTRVTNKLTRWIDQGASYATLLAQTPNRYLAGCIEVELKKHVSDRTSWQKMLKNAGDTSIDLHQKKQLLSSTLPNQYNQYILADQAITHIHYPVKDYPHKIKSISLDKLIEFNLKLTGIRGQYLIFADGLVFNVRKHTGYEVIIDY